MNAYSNNLKNMSDLELLHLCRDGRESALRDLYERYSKLILGYLINMLGCKEDAEEILADVFIKVWKSAGRFRGDCKVSSWIYRIAANSAKDFIRSNKEKNDISIEDTILAETDIVDCKAGNPQEKIIINEEQRKLIAAMQKLNSEDKTIIYLYHFKEMDYLEINSITGISINNLKIKLFRARQKLKKIFMESNYDADEMQENTAAAAGLCEKKPELA